MNFKFTFPTRWSDFDMNRHMRHTAYNDYAAEARVRFFNDVGYSLDSIAADGFGPVLFSEHTYFKREIHSGEDITVNVKLHGLSENKHKWKFKHEILNSKGEVTATIEVYGAWIDLQKRRIARLPEHYETLWNTIDKTDDFEII